MRIGTTFSGTPRLPRTYVPRPRLWNQLERTAEQAVTVVVAPSGAGKTLGVAGWLGQREPTRHHWVDAASSGGAREFVEATAAPDAGGVPPYVVVDDAHLLSAEALRHLDDRLNNAPETLRLLLISRWDLPLTRLVPELLGHYTSLRGTYCGWTRRRRRRW
ncbi:ATP-binding protein [Nocardioides alcanivorans]|uniref:ATP-binding protein n=1 Tax=Nocardioides alcanivorans TaxID=2897352 RepID=UPI001F1ADD7F|nr:hypothetical protein [Nocardioides alcanivorans]